MALLSFQKRSEITFRIYCACVEKGGVCMCVMQFINFMNGCLIILVNFTIYKLYLFQLLNEVVLFRIVYRNLSACYDFQRILKGANELEVNILLAPGEDTVVSHSFIHVQDLLFVVKKFLTRRQKDSLNLHKLLSE